MLERTLTSLFRKTEKIVILLFIEIDETVDNFNLKPSTPCVYRMRMIYLHVTIYELYFQLFNSGTTCYMRSISLR